MKQIHHHVNNILLILHARRIQLIAFLGAILLLSAIVLFSPIGFYSCYNSYRLDYSIYSHSSNAVQQGAWRPDFTDCIDIVEEMVSSGEAAEVVTVLVNNIESRQRLRQMTAMLLLDFVDKHEAIKVIPVLQNVASDENEHHSIRVDAQATIDKLSKNEAISP
ncbi:MAG: hypothetical protein KDA78_10465 [Planctomycetaceae bacterium]|nr:hypothetical protein [Planctomycetaceae bacterium]